MDISINLIHLLSFSFSADVGQSRVPYPVASTTKETADVVSDKEAAATRLASAKDAARAAYAYQPGKTYRTKRVFKVTGLPLILFIPLIMRFLCFSCPFQQFHFLVLVKFLII